MTEIYLFDWGDTLMVDFPGEPGKMCDWETVQKDIEPALKLGINAIWLCKEPPENPAKGVTIISSLEELCSQ